METTKQTIDYLIQEALHNHLYHSEDEFGFREEDDTIEYFLMVPACEMVAPKLCNAYKRYCREMERSAKEDFKLDLKYGHISKTKTFEEYLEEYEAENDLVGVYRLVVEVSDDTYVISAIGEISRDGIKYSPLEEKTLFRRTLKLGKKPTTLNHRILNGLNQAVAKISTRL
jgi:hypothetical protein